jgi:hypothetical protein
MSTKNLKFLVNELNTLVDGQLEVETAVPPSVYVGKKDELLSSIIEQATSMKEFNLQYPDRHRENFQERQNLVDSVTGNS